MAKYRIRINSDTDIGEVLQKFKNTYNREGGNKEELQFLFHQVESAVNDLVGRGRKLVQMGSSYQIRQTIENSICDVFIEIDFNKKKPSVFSTIRGLILRSK